jgi:hypothetical protein
LHNFLAEYRSKSVGLLIDHDHQRLPTQRVINLDFVIEFDTITFGERYDCLLEGRHAAAEKSGLGRSVFSFSRHDHGVNPIYRYTVTPFDGLADFDFVSRLGNYEGVVTRRLGKQLSLLGHYRLDKNSLSHFDLCLILSFRSGS